jgi:hypothetical protein
VADEAPVDVQAEAVADEAPVESSSCAARHHGLERRPRVADN